ncbi:LVIVD repeat-containing protein [Nocardia fluminea]|uniref:LVIVD repeat-containing protein n=1 Tax=Nocardia fluminea TaxID=134984 RepID=UPI003D13CB35
MPPRPHADTRPHAGSTIRSGAPGPVPPHRRRHSLVRYVSAAAITALVAVGLPSGASADFGADLTGAVQEFLEVGRTAVPRADCGPGSLPETGLQGDVPAGDRDSGRSTQGYRCNMSMVGGYAGRGAGITSTSFEHCAYMGTFFPGNMLSEHPGVQVLDVSDPANPRLTATLAEPAMLAGTWETLKVNTTRKLLVGTGVPVGIGAGYLSVYDISDCARPRLLNPGTGSNLAMPLPITTHEGGFSPDGRTYWASGVVPGFLSAIDLTDPANPRVIWQGLTGIEAHGLGVSPDGNRLYISALGGFTVLDVSAVQRRDPNPHVPHRGRTFWTDGWATQHSVPVTYDGVPHLFTVDEGGSGGVKLIDVSDDSAPRITAKIKLEINLPQHIDAGIGSSMGGSAFSYESHYCTADRPDNPTALACGWISSGIRVFDVRDPGGIREIAYFNPPARTGRNLEIWNSPHALASIIGIPVMSAPAALRSMAEGLFDPAQVLTARAGDVAFGDLSTDWCLSPPEWRGDQLYVTCSDNGFMVLQLDNAVYTPPADQQSTVGS